MPCRTLSVELEWVKTAPSTARHLIGAWLDGFGCEHETRERAVLVVSELVSTAVDEHVGTPILDAELWHGTFTLWVSNGGSLDDHSGADDDCDPRARVLSATCDDWGVDSGAASFATRHDRPLRCRRCLTSPCHTSRATTTHTPGC